MQFKSYNHNVFLIEENRRKLVKKIGYQFPERIHRESKILKILSQHPGIPQIEDEDMSAKMPFIKLSYIDAKVCNCLEKQEFAFAMKQIARWLKQFATSKYILPSEISKRYSARQRDAMAFKKVKNAMKEKNLQEFTDCLNRIEEYQIKGRIHCAHRDFRVDHVFVDNSDVWAIDWESASDGYMLQDGGNFIASIIKQSLGFNKAKYISIFAKELTMNNSEFAMQELIDWTIFSLLWGYQIKESLDYIEEANSYLNFAKALARENCSDYKIFLQLKKT